MSDWTTEIEAKWQKRWYDAKINEAERDARPKFMIIFAYPGLTGYLHVGHMRGYTYVDAIARYMRMTGYNVMFPVGTHATGNGAISLARRVEKGDPKTIEYLKNNGCSDEDLEKLKDPLSVVSFFNDVYIKQYWQRFGFLADWRRFTSTVNPGYSKFIQWQFRKLHDRGLLMQKPYFAPACIECGPVAVDASETDLSKGGNAETTEYTLLKFKCGDFFLVAATVRPETVYGQTNFWVNPDVEYVKVKVNDEIWVISPQSFEKMKLQKDGLELVGTVAGRELIGKTATAPVIHREIPVLPAKFCKPDVGTGLVTSVPSDAPDDWISLRLLKDNEEMLKEYGLDPAMVKAIKVIPIIETKGYGPFPAAELIEKMGITEAGDPRLDEAKKMIYKDGFHTGVMNLNCGKFAGLKVEEAKEQMKQMMLASGEADLFYDLSEEVICRCGQPVFIKKVPDQWFIDYANPEITEMTKEHCRGMHILPTDYYNNVQGVLDWFRERACVRQGNWLGTRFPYDDKWIIEAISDSTLYPVYYIVSKYFAEGTLHAEEMTEEFFDFVMLGKGERDTVAKNTGVDINTLQNIRDDVLYWYPLDLNLGGKEHMTVHFPAFLMNHTAVLPDSMWPRGIFVNWYVTGKLGKISKSNGGAEPIPDAAGKFGVDALRLYYAHIAVPFADVAWDEDAIVTYEARVERILRTIESLKELKGTELREIDAWLISRMNTRIDTIREAMREYDIRGMANEVYFEALNDMRWYMRRGGNNEKTARKALRLWLKMMAPITPHIAEEVWESLGNTDFVSVAEYPVYNEDDEDFTAEIAEEYLDSVIADVKEILKVIDNQNAKALEEDANAVAKKPQTIYIYTTPMWKMKVQNMAKEMLGNLRLPALLRPKSVMLEMHRAAMEDDTVLETAIDAGRKAASHMLAIPALTKAVMTNNELKKRGKESADFAKKLAEDFNKKSDVEIAKATLDLNEYEYLKEAESFLSAELGYEVKVYSADDDRAPDPQKKARASAPKRPAIYIDLA